MLVPKTYRICELIDEYILFLTTIFIISPFIINKFCIIYLYESHSVRLINMNRYINYQYNNVTSTLANNSKFHRKSIILMRHLIDSFSKSFNKSPAFLILLNKIIYVKNILTFRCGQEKKAKKSSKR